eukprot:2248463-Rhodomonas_salina.2
MLILHPHAYPVPVLRFDLLALQNDFAGLSKSISRLLFRAFFWACNGMAVWEFSFSRTSMAYVAQACTIRRGFCTGFSE